MYVREIHPGDHYAQPQDQATKSAHARAYADRDGIDWTVLVDDLDGDLHQRLDRKPDAWYRVGTDGTVLASGLWTSATEAVTSALDAAAHQRPIPNPQDESKLRPMLRGTGEMWSTLSAAGPVALRDIAAKAPPMALTAAVAGVVPLRSPLARGAAAVALITAGAVAALASWRFRRR